MTVFLGFLADNAPYIYAFCAVVALYFLRVAIRARRERRAAVFPLERELALARTYRTFGVALLLLLIMGATYFTVHRLIPRLRELPVASTPTPGILVLIDTPTPTPPPPTATPTPAPTPTLRPTRRPPPTPEPTREPAPVVRPPACPHPGAAIASPGIGQVLRGDTPVVGTASIEGFQFFKLEWSAAGSDQWHWFAGSETPAVGTVLGVFRAGSLPPGQYVIRLVVVDNTGNYPPPCQVSVVIP